MSEQIRKRIIFFGDVQGVGFRQRASYYARELSLTGFVKNEWDGSVLMEIQGSSELIDKVLVLINKSNYINIQNMKVDLLELEKGELGFHVR